jgi:hypothetical protein
LDATLTAILAALATIVLVVVATTRMSRRGPGSGASSGIANWAADVDAMLQPHHPTADAICTAKEQDEEKEDDGDPPDPVAS